MGDLERALALDRVDGRHWRVIADRDYEVVNAMYGGWTVGVMLGAVEQAAAQTSEEHLRLWSPHGELPATSEQLARYR